jgi:trehalose-6-phosphatase
VSLVFSVTDVYCMSLQDRLGLAAEHGFFFRAAGEGEWEARFGEADEQAAWKEMTRPILELYTESTDGSNIEAKDSALVCDRDLVYRCTASLADRTVQLGSVDALRRLDRTCTTLLGM